MCTRSIHSYSCTHTYVHIYTYSILFNNIMGTTDTVKWLIDTFICTGDSRGRVGENSHLYVTAPDCPGDAGEERAGFMQAI